MNKLLILFTFILPLELYSIEINDFFIDCRNVSNCDFQRVKFDSLPKKYASKQQLLELLNEISDSSSDYRINFKVETVSGKASVFISFIPYLKILGVDIESKSGVDLSKFPFPQQGSTWNKDIESKLVEDLTLYLQTLGYANPKIGISSTIDNYKMVLRVKIEEGPIQRISQIFMQDQSLVESKLHKELKSFIGKAWDKTQFESDLSQLELRYKAEGYYLFDLGISKIEKKSLDSVIPTIAVDYGLKFAFDIKGNKFFGRGRLINFLKDLFIEQSGELSVTKIEESLKDFYLENGLYNTEVNIHKRLFDNKGVRNEFYFIEINEGRRIKVVSLEFSGNKAFSSDVLERLYVDKGSTLSKREFLDYDYLKKFQVELKKIYLSHGYVFFKSIEPSIEIDKTNYEASVSFILTEGRQSKWSYFNFIGLPPNVKQEILKGVKNKEGFPLNLVNLKSDIELIEQNMKEIGFLFAQIVNKKSKNIVKYTSDFGAAELVLKISAGKRINLNDIVVVGLENTKKFVVTREVGVKAGDLLSPSKLRAIRGRLSSLGIFSSINVSPLVTSDPLGAANLLISVREKKFRYLELAPGFRSDIGLKFSLAYGNNNIWRRNHKSVFMAQVNQRVDYSNFDERRSQERESSLEFQSSARYIYPYFLNLNLELSSEISFIRRKLRSFDADILRGNILLSKDWGKLFNSKFLRNVSSTIRFQLENIRQYDATNPSDAGNFTVGTLSPGITVDLRDRNVNPRNGAIFNLSYDLAIPEFGSRDDDQEIHYTTLTSRNAFYYSPTDYFTLALSLTTGVQKNLSNEIKIPDIKVFRLTGIDRIRGYKDVESNRVFLDGFGYLDVEDVQSLNRVYFANIKFEPRYLVNDSLVFAPFIDAGRIMLDDYDLKNLNSSAGISLKFVTPVGTLNFDYGMKLHRRRFQEQGEIRREEVGRFHLTLGVF